MDRKAALDRARAIDGADHHVERIWTGKCMVCGGMTYHNPSAPGAPVHREQGQKAAAK